LLARAFERFTDEGWQAVELAQDEARDLDHPHVGTEHLLLGLMRLENGAAASALRELGLNLEQAREQVKRVIGPVAAPPPGRIPFTPRAEKVLELALREAQALGHSEVQTEHVLLAIRDEGEGVGARVLQDFTIHSAQIREELGLLAARPNAADPAAVPKHGPNSLRRLAGFVVVFGLGVLAGRSAKGH